ncbi:preprotein translocase subunit SecG [Aerococcus kribbianus]|uniref:Protein-export membrane protein SecG n=1 Tax=Aerococcus kribbianus TaxID=2999064 RepID=A0A9X3FVF0_9LACT|nr:MULTISPECIES: preprotein translocase subunit SecG [unclassified Aerococcus]MCZ0716954.1 preprotein translocase subunit SecG [Aerococcus sp. YH-aer221]MCZ0725242.1 preprotein translocase subunit SecG [Aerococcus sp. YH-aer222]
MYQTLMTAIIIVSVLLIFIVVIQPSKNNAASNLTGGAEALFGKNKKARGFEAVLNKMTIILGFIFMVLALLLAKLSS